jgi:hypothetical protein
LKEPNIILASEAARQWGCTAQAVYNAIDTGRLTEVRMGRHRMVVKDKNYRDFKVKEFGGRLHEKYKSKEKGE